MKKRGAAKSIKEEAKSLSKAQEEVLFSLFFWKLKKRHFYSFSSLIFSIVIGLAIVKSIRDKGIFIESGFVFSIAFISLSLLTYIVAHRIHMHKKPLSMFRVINLMVSIILMNLFFVSIFTLLNYHFTSEMLLLKELIFITALSTFSSTVSLNIH